jgi:hypothetical protein
MGWSIIRYAEQIWFIHRINCTDQIVSQKKSISIDTDSVNILNLTINTPGYSWQITTSVSASVFNVQHDAVLLAAKKVRV